MPSPPPSDEPVARPKAIDSAFHAVLASVAISAVGTLVTVLLDRTQLTVYVNQLLKDLPRDQQVDADSMVGAFQVFLGISIAVFAALFTLFAVKMRTGRNWARILLTLYTAYGVMTFLAAVASSGAELGLMWSLAEVAFGVTAVVYMFRPESTKYFVETRQRRLRARQRP